jgi:hypothetical protein
LRAALELLDDARLADARLAEQQARATVTCTRFAERVEQALQHALAPDEWRLVHLERHGSRRLGARLRRRGHRLHEAIAAAVHGRDALVAAALAERLAQARHGDRDGVVGHRAALPHDVDQLFLRDEPAGVADERGQEAQDDWIDLEQRARAPQLEVFSVELEVVERVQHAPQSGPGP